MPRNTASLFGLAFVLALHAAGLWALWNLRILSTPDQVVTLFVETLRPEIPPALPQAKPQPIRKERPPAPQLAAQAPIRSPAEPVAAPPPPVLAPAIEVQLPLAGPVTLATELSVTCPERTPPAYPPLSRRLGEEGKVVLRVELDEQGAVSAAKVATGSGSVRLDEAALSAVKTWRCTPARRDGQPVRAVALQPFKFVLEGN